MLNFLAKYVFNAYSENLDEFYQQIGGFYFVKSSKTFQKSLGLFPLSNVDRTFR